MIVTKPKERDHTFKIVQSYPKFVDNVADQVCDGMGGLHVRSGKQGKPDVKSTAKPAMTKGTEKKRFGQVYYVKAQPEHTIAKAFPPDANDQSCGDVASFHMAIRNGMFPRGWKDIPEEKRKLPFVFRAALEEALLNGLGPLELDEVRRMAVEYGDACVFHKAILGGLFPGGWKDIPEEERKTSIRPRSCAQNAPLWHSPETSPRRVVSSDTGRHAAFANKAKRLPESIVS